MAGQNFTESCLYCKFYLSQSAICRRYPEYRQKRESEWCGEFISIPPVNFVTLEETKPRKKATK